MGGDDILWEYQEYCDNKKCEQQEGVWALKFRPFYEYETVAYLYEKDGDFFYRMGDFPRTNNWMDESLDADSLEEAKEKIENRLEESLNEDISYYTHLYTKFKEGLEAAREEEEER